MVHKFGVANLDMLGQTIRRNDIRFWWIQGENEINGNPQIGNEMDNEYAQRFLIQ